MYVNIFRHRAYALLAGILLFSSPLAAEHSKDVPDGPVLTALLHAFLAGASEDDPVVHDRFWSERLVYTSSGGQRFGKADIMAGLEQPEDEGAEGEEATVYSAEDIQVQQFGDAAVVAFRLVASPMAAETERTEYFNTGTFLKEQGRWQAVAWQATKITTD